MPRYNTIQKRLHKKDLNLETKNDVMYDSFPKLFKMGSLHHSECHFDTQIDAVCTRPGSHTRCNACTHTHTHKPLKLLQLTGLKLHAKVHKCYINTVYTRTSLTRQNHKNKNV